MSTRRAAYAVWAVLGAAAMIAASCRSGRSGRSGGEPSSPVSQPPARMRTPGYLPSVARDLLFERMQDHGTQMTELLWAVLFLDDAGVGEISAAIDAEPRFSRPIGKDDPTINALLPEEFFRLQDQLGAKAKELSALAHASKPDGVAMAKIYGELAQTCVQCHAIYLRQEQL